MQFKPYRKPDGSEEIRFKPETMEDCESIEDCKKCFFEDSNDSFNDFLRELGAELFTPSSPTRKSSRHIREPHRESSSHIVSLEDLMENYHSHYNSPPGTLRGGKKIGVGSIMALPFTVVNGKVVTDPETMELMKELGIIEELERMIREEEDEN